MKGYDRLQDEEDSGQQQSRRGSTRGRGGYEGINLSDDDERSSPAGSGGSTEQQLVVLEVSSPVGLAVPVAPAVPVPAADATREEAARPAQAPKPADFSIRIICVDNTEFHIELSGGDAAATTSLGDVRAIVTEKSSVPPERQRLIFSGRILDDDGATLGSLGIQNGACVHFCPRPENVPAAADVAETAEMAAADAEVAFWRRLLEMRSTEAAPPPELNASESLMRLANSAKLVAAILLFYFMVVLTFMVAVLFKPDEVHQEVKRGESAFPHWVIVAVRVVQPIAAIYGLVVAYTGLKGVVTFSVRLTKRFYYGLIGLALIQLVLSVEYDADFSKQSTIVGTILNVAISVVFWGFCCESVRKFLVALQLSTGPTTTAEPSPPRVDVGAVA